MSGFGEDFKAFRIIVWHSINFAEGRIRFMPYLDVLKIKELKVEHIGSSIIIIIIIIIIITIYLSIGFHSLSGIRRPVSYLDVCKFSYVY